MKKIAADRNYRLFKKATPSGGGRWLDVKERAKEVIQSALEWHVDLGTPEAPWGSSEDITEVTAEILLKFEKDSLLKTTPLEI